MRRRRLSNARRRGYRPGLEELERRWVLSALNVVGHRPPMNTHSAPVDAEIGVTLDHAIDPTSVSSNTFAVHGMQTGQLLEPANVVSASAESLSLRPARSFFPGELVQATATRGIEDPEGDALVAPHVWQFRTGVGQGNGRGTGVYSESGQSLSGSGATQGDVDRDGDLDLIADAVWFNDGTGQFRASGQRLGLVHMGDVDGDGDLDAVGRRVWQNNGQGRFTEWGRDLEGSVSALGDLDSDGDLDAIGESVWLNDGEGGYSDIDSAFHGLAHTLGDLDGDGDLDTIVGGLSDTRVWINDGQAGFTDHGQSLEEPHTVEFFDLDGDGELDYHAGGQTHRSNGVALGDADGDGDLDAFVMSSVSHVYGTTEKTDLWLNDGEGRFGKTSQSFPSKSIALGDIDGDGDLDVLVGRRGRYGYAASDLIWRNDGHGVFVDTGQQLGFLPTEAVASGDYDGDGDLDAFFSGGGVGQVWLNTDLHSDLSVTNTDGQPTYRPGGQVTYTITVRNHGPEGIDGVTVTDVFPEAVTDVDWTCSATEGSTCTPHGDGDIYDTVSLLPRGKVTYRATGTVEAKTRGTISNTAAVAAPSELQDLDPANNWATDTSDVDVSWLRFAPLQPGDANQDGYFDASDIIEVLQAGKYLTGEPVTWGEGDWDSAPGGASGDPPAGNGTFDQLDLIAAMVANLYSTGAYADVGPPKSDLACVGRHGTWGDGQTSLIYDSYTGELSIDAPAGRNLTSIRIVSQTGIFTGDPAQNVDGTFDIDTDHEIFKSTFGSSFGSLSFGNVIHPNLSPQIVQTDLKVDGSLDGGGDLGQVDWGHLNQQWPELVLVPVVAPIPDLTVDQDSPPMEAYVDIPFVYSRLRAETNFATTSTNSRLLTARVDDDGTLDLAFAPNTAGRATITVRASVGGSECARPAYVRELFDVTIVPSASLGDVNADGRFDQLDIDLVLRAAKYSTRDPATWQEGDWTLDGVFDQFDIVAALQTDSYVRG